MAKVYRPLGDPEVCVCTCSFHPTAGQRYGAIYRSKFTQKVNFSCFRVLNMLFHLPGEGQLGTERQCSGACLWPGRLLTI